MAGSVKRSLILCVDSPAPLPLLTVGFHSTGVVTFSRERVVHGNTVAPVEVPRSPPKGVCVSFTGPADPVGQLVAEDKALVDRIPSSHDGDGAVFPRVAVAGRTG